MTHLPLAIRKCVVLLRRHWYEALWTHANRRGQQPVLLQFESVQALASVVERAVADERALGLKRLTEAERWGQTGVVQLKYVDLINAFLTSQLDKLGVAQPGQVLENTGRIAEGLRCIEELARQDTADADGYATGSVRRVRAALLTQPPPIDSLARLFYRKFCSRI